MRTTKLNLISSYGIEYDAWIIHDAKQTQVKDDVTGFTLVGGITPTVLIASIPCELHEGCMLLRSKDGEIQEYRSDTSELGKSLYILKRLKQFEYDQLIRKEDNTIYLIV